MRTYIAILDREHLDNSLFLATFAKSLAEHGGRKGIILHGDSEYTDRIMQTGVMREEAQIRATKDLNRRLIGLFADHGISTIGIHGYQRELISRKDDELKINLEQINQLPQTPCLLISNLIENKGKTEPVSLAELATHFLTYSEGANLVIFSKNEKDELLGFSEEKELKWEGMKSDFEENVLPKEFQNLNQPALLTTATDFRNWPNLNNVVKIC